jgi:hypothetical protein
MVILTSGSPGAVDRGLDRGSPGSVIAGRSGDRGVRWSAAGVVAVGAGATSARAGRARSGAEGLLGAAARAVVAPPRCGVGSAAEAVVGVADGAVGGGAAGRVAG